MNNNRSHKYQTVEVSIQLKAGKYLGPGPSGNT